MNNFLTLITVLISMILNACSQDNLKTDNLLIKDDSIVNIELLINTKGMAKLEQKRLLALYDGHLYTTDDDWVDAKLIYNTDTIDAEVRLKGDYYDHWIDENVWSFKVKLKGGKTFFGMRRFALQNAKVRSYLNEWFFHQFQKELNLTFLRYDFLKLKVNGVDMPIYAIEENFDKYLIEHNELREGVVFQLSDKDYWAQWGTKAKPIDTHFGASLIPYQKRKILKNEKLAQQLKIVRNLITQYHRGELDAHQVFDVTKMAKFFVVTDLLGYHHACYSDNVKFYYNPVTSLIEPIGYDNQNIKPLSVERLLGERKSLGKIIPLTAPTQNDQSTNKLQYNSLFSDPVFYNEYIHQVHELTRDSLLDKLFEKLEPAIKLREEFIQFSKKYYIFKERNFVLENRNYIQDSILTLSDEVLGHIIESSDGTCTIQLLNTKTLPVKINSFSIGNEIVQFESNYVLQPWMNKNNYAQFKINHGQKALSEINLNISLYGLSHISSSIKIFKKECVIKSDNSLAFVSFEKNNGTYLNKEISHEELNKRLQKANSKRFIDNGNAGVHVYFKNYSEENQTVTLGITNLSNQIVEVINLTYYDKWVFNPETKVYIANGNWKKAPNYKEIDFKVPQLRKEHPKMKAMNFPWHDKMIENLRLNIRHPGAINHKSQEVFPWAYENKGILDTNIIRQAANFKSFEFLNVNELKKEVWIEEGEHIITTGIKIPKGYSVFAKENTTLNFTNASFLLSYSPVLFSGTSDEPIIITSSDKTGMGIIVLNANSKSTFNYVNFSNNRALDRFGMSLTGMLTFYESDVEFDNCELSHNNSEDILNIVRSNYKISNCFIHDVFSDALDCDFSTGSVNNVKFKDAGNDAIDISGRSIELFNVSIDNAEDKGVSAGENSIMKGDQITITNSGIGVSAKDLSSIKFGKLILEENKLDFAVFQKKSEYGPAKIVIEKTKESKNYLLEFGSSLSINGEFKKDYRDNVLGLLYGNLYGKNSH